MIARTVGGLCLVTVPGLVLLSLADALVPAVLLIGLAVLVPLLAVVAVSRTAPRRPA